MDDCKVGLVDDHKMFTESLAGLINKFENYRVVLEAANGHELRNLLNGGVQAPDIILLDVSMPLMDGFETALWLRRHFPDIRVIAVSTSNHESVIMKMLRNGCRGFVLKEMRPSELRRALDEVMARGFYFTDYVTGRMLHSLQNEQATKDGAPNPDKLTEKEIELLRYVSTEMTYKEIAEQMGISVKTVDGYRENLFIKLNVKSRMGLALYAIKKGIVEI
jgi:two-component system, NarL family, invasion response regulator UvrY